jgi:hypothetical protein
MEDKAQGQQQASRTQIAEDEIEPEPWRAQVAQMY